MAKRPTHDPRPVQPPLAPVAARLLERAQAELENGQPALAISTLTNVLALASGNIDAIRLMGIAARQLGNCVLAIDCFRKVLATQPDDADIHGALGIVLQEHGDFDEAAAHLRRACELAPASARMQFNLGSALKQQAHLEAATTALETAIAIDPSYLAARLELARAQVSLGRIDAAVSEFRKVLQRHPESPKAWFGLSNLQTVRFSDDEMDRLRRAYDRSGATDDARTLLGFAYAKALEDRGDYAQAFEVLKIANALQRRLSNWDAARSHARVEAILRVFAQPASPPVDPALGKEVIFIVGIPRSGTSLVEHILASHADVEGANEISDLPSVIQAETRRRDSPFPLWVPSTSPRDWQRLGGEYLARTTRWRERKPRFTDKNLVTWYLVGAALRMLPAARVVIVRRDPLETCVACYRQRFTGNAGFANDLDEMADYCMDFMRLTRFWLGNRADRVFDLEYEKLVADPEQTIRRLLVFCGLRYDPACVSFHETHRAVRSIVSAAQVRQPIRRDTARASRYGDKLEPLRKRLRSGSSLAP